MPRKAAAPNRYNVIIEKIFFDNYKAGVTRFEFQRDDIKDAANALNIVIPDNVGDLIYFFRFRKDLPDSIQATHPEGRSWRIELAGHGVYRFVLGSANRIVPNPSFKRIKIPDATPELISGYALDDEQALLAVVRYNRLIDTFLGITTYSLQNHLRTTVKGMGQIEIDELYVGVDTHGCHYVIPVQAKGGNDKISVVQTTQDINACNEKFPGIACRAISVQFMDESVVAMFELTIQDEEIRIVEERHYLLVPNDQLDPAEIRAYRTP